MVSINIVNEGYKSTYIISGYQLVGRVVRLLLGGELTHKHGSLGEPASEQCSKLLVDVFLGCEKLPNALRFS